MKAEHETERLKTGEEIIDDLKREYGFWASNSRKPFSSLDIALLSLRQIVLLEAILAQLGGLKSGCNCSTPPPPPGGEA